MRGDVSTLTGRPTRRTRVGVGMRRLLMLAYLVIGLVVATSHHYIGSGRLDSLKGIAEAVLALVLWPLVLLGVHMHL